MSRHWHTVRDLVIERNLHVLADIGVLRGRSPGRIIDASGNIVQQYWLIDPWKEYTPPNEGRGRFTEVSGDGHLLGCSQATMDRFYHRKCRQMVRCSQLRVVRMRSLEAVRMFPNAFFDLIYIDALHYYDDVLADLKAWLPKVRSGGIFSGHDYPYEDVKRAVHEVVGQENITEGCHGAWFTEI